MSSQHDIPCQDGRLVDQTPMRLTRYRPWATGPPCVATPCQVSPPLGSVWAVLPRSQPMKYRNQHLQPHNSRRVSAKMCHDSDPGPGLGSVWRPDRPLRNVAAGKALIYRIHVSPANQLPSNSTNDKVRMEGEACGALPSISTLPARPIPHSLDFGSLGSS